MTDTRLIWATPPRVFGDHQWRLEVIADRVRKRGDFRYSWRPLGTIQWRHMYTWPGYTRENEDRSALPENLESLYIDNLKTAAEMHAHAHRVATD